MHNGHIKKKINEEDLNSSVFPKIELISYSAYGFQEKKSVKKTLD